MKGLQRFTLIGVSIFWSLNMTLASASGNDDSRLPKNLIRIQQNSPFTNGSIRKATPTEEALWKETQRQLLVLARSNPSQQQISWLNFNELAREFEKIQIYVNTSDEAVVGSGTRSGSVYFPLENTLIINLSRLWNLRKNAGSAIMTLHEFLGALGYPDENFEISSAWYLRLHSQTIGQQGSDELTMALKRHLDANPRRTVDPTFRVAGGGGGISGVGGGGDPDLAEIKSYLLIGMINAEGVKTGDRDRLISTILSAPIEPLSGSNGLSRISKPIFKGMSYAQKDGEVVVAVDTDYWERIRNDQNGNHLVERSEFISNLITLTLQMKDKSVSTSLSSSRGTP